LVARSTPILGVPASGGVVSDPHLLASHSPQPGDTTALPDELRSRWHDFCVEWNRRGFRILLWLGLLLYPAFGVLDWLVADPKWLWLLWSTRILFTACTAAMVLFVVGKPVFARHAVAFTSIYSVIAGLGIPVMVLVMGGLKSHYYVGLILVMVAAGTLFLWPQPVVVRVHLALVASYLLPNVDGFLRAGITRDDVLTGVSNLFFLTASAFVMGVGQTFGYRSQLEQLRTRMDLERTQADLQRANDQLSALDRFKSQFFANITHELKTPLAMILSPLELLIDGSLGSATEAQKSTFASMQRSGVKLLKLINDLLELTKLEQARVQLHVRDHDLVPYLRGLAAQIEALAKRKGVALVFETDAAAAVVPCDLERMERVFVNLLANATKFTPPGGRVWVRVRDGADNVTVEVEDNGPGFPQELADRVFERFFQVDMAETRKQGGTGIGLALAKELTVLHGGTIAARAEVGRGACFTVLLHKGRDHFRPEVLAQHGAPQPTTEADLLHSAVHVQSVGGYRLLEVAEATERRVVERDRDENERRWTALVVEDTADVIRVIHLVMRREFKVMAARDGLQGLAMALRERPNLIITDLMMPGIDGLELTRRLRADKATQHTPIIMLTARGTTEDRVKGIATGVDAYLAKPFSPKELLTTAHHLLDIQETQAQRLLHGRLDGLEAIAGGMAHEINNPLNYLKNALTLARHDLRQVRDLATVARTRPLDDTEAKKLEMLDGRLDKMFVTAESGVKRIGKTVELMGRYSREGFSRQAEACDVFAVAQDVVATVLPATGRAVEVAVAADGDGTVLAVPEELGQVLSNLVQNAIEAAPESTGKVSVRGRVEAGEVVVEIEDNGPGIDPAQKARIFEPFFTTKAPGRGMGLGLTIVRRVVQQSGGRVELDSELGKGTRFTVRLPRSNVA
jgi:signal transduction histidine kinase